MNTKHPRPALSTIHYVAGFVCLGASVVYFFVGVDKGGRKDEYFSMSFALFVSGFFCFGIGGAVHSVIDSLARIVESNEQLAGKLAPQMVPSPQLPPNASGGSVSHPPSPALVPINASSVAQAHPSLAPIVITNSPPSQAPRWPQSESTVYCSNCQQKITFPAEMAGTKADCPNCGNPLTLNV